MKTNETNIAKKLSLEEIEALPKASVIWRGYVFNSDEGIVWHSIEPLLVCVPGKDGVLMGGDKNSYVDLVINEHLFDDPTDTYWNQEPTDSQLPGITREEYDAFTEENRIVFTGLASAITSKGMTFKGFCKQNGMNYNSFWNAITGNREFLQKEIVAIRTTLELSDDEAREIFFPESAALARI